MKSFQLRFFINCARLWCQGNVNSANLSLDRSLQRLGRGDEQRREIESHFPSNGDDLDSRLLISISTASSMGSNYEAALIYVSEMFLRCRDFSVHSPRSAFNTRITLKRIHADSVSTWFAQIGCELRAMSRANKAWGWTVGIEVMTNFLTFPRDNKFWRCFQLVNAMGTHETVRTSTKAIYSWLRLANQTKEKVEILISHIKSFPNISGIIFNKFSNKTKRSGCLLKIDAGGEAASAAKDYF